MEKLKNCNIENESEFFGYDEARKFIEDTSVSGVIMGTERVQRLLEELGNPQDDLKIIHIAGTNGKGSTVAMLSTVLKEAGYRVGRYISPTLVTYLERIQINGEYISETDFSECTYTVKKACEHMVLLGFSHPTVYEVETAIAFVYFKKMNCDFVALECLMGGRDDATNVCHNPLMCVFTSIGLDHMGILGPTVSDIAANKAGIIKSGAKVITIKQQYTSSQTVIENAAKSAGCEFYVADFDSDASEVHYELNNTSYIHKDYGLISLKLNGTYQIKNSVLVIKCIDVLRKMGYNISQTAVTNGIEKTGWFGRMTVLGNSPLFIVDGAHNEPAAIELSDTVKNYFTPKFRNGRKIVFIMGVFKDKNYEKIIDIMAPYADHIFTIMTPDNVRAMDERELAKVINARAHRELAMPCGTIKEAVRTAISYNNGDVIVLAFGSLSHLDTIRKEYDLYG